MANNSIPNNKEKAPAVLLYPYSGSRVLAFFCALLEGANVTSKVIGGR